MLPVGGQFRASARVHGVRTGLRLGKAVGGHQIRRDETWQVALLLILGPIEHDRQRPDPSLGTVTGGIGGVPGHAFGDDHGRCEVHFEASIGLRNESRDQAQFG